MALASRELTILVGILLVYSMLSDPTPESVTFVEIGLGAGLVGLVGLSWMTAGPRRFDLAFQAFFFVALFFGLLSAIDNDVTQALRDVVAHFFLCAAVLWRRRLSQDAVQSLLFWMAVCGGIIAARFLWEAGFDFGAIERQRVVAFDGLLKLNTDPLVTFSACYGVCVILDRRRLSLLQLAAATFAAILAITAIGVSALRGPLAIVAMVTLVVLLRSLGSRSASRLILFAALAALSAPLWVPFLGYVAQNFITKSSQVGDNAKWAEFTTVLRGVFDSGWWNSVFGAGFGAVIDVGRDRVLPFTHNVFSYYLAKTGVVATLLLLLTFVLGGVQYVRQRAYRDPIWLGLGLILLYGLLLNPHYKYLTFGVVVVALANFSAEWSRRGSAVAAAKPGSTAERYRLGMDAR